MSGLLLVVKIKDMELRENPNYKDDEDNACPDTRRLDTASSIPHMAFKESSGYIWVLANAVIFRLQQQTHLTLHDYMDFLHRSRWKLVRHKRDRELVGNYLTVLDV